MKQNYKSFAMIVGFMFFIVGGALAQTANKVESFILSSPASTNVFPGDGKVYIQWNSVDDPTLLGYIVYRDDTKYGNFDNGTFTLVDTVAKEDTVYVDNTVSNWNNYKYWVTAYSGGDESEPSPDYEGLFAYPRPRVDEFGYTWSSNRDSDNPQAPVYQWTDISTSGTPVPMNGDNVNTGYYPVGFYFPFYNFAFDSFRISTNGIISFTSSTTYTASNVWNEFPFYSGEMDVKTLKNNSYEEGNILAPFWADLYFPGEQTSAYYQDFGDYMIIQFDHVPLPEFKTSGFGEDNTFQVILYKNGYFEFVYQKVSEPWGLIIGWQNYSETDGITITYMHGEMQSTLEGIDYENLIIRGGYDFSGVETQVPNLFTFEYNWVPGKVQASPNPHKIYQIPVTGNFATIVQNDIYEAKDVALDMSEEKIYWIDTGNDDILRSDFDGGNREIFFNFNSDGDSPNNLAIDSHNGFLFWSDYNFRTIKRISLDGTNLVTLTDGEAGVQVPEKIALDIEHEKIYWTDGEMQSIYWMNYDGSGLGTILTGTSVYDLVVYPGENTIYFVDGSYQINRIDLDGSNEDIVAEPGSDVMDIALDADANRLYWTYSNYGADNGIGYIDIDTIEETYIIGMLNELNTLNIDLPLAPVHPEVSAEVGYIEIKWPANTDAALSGYKIFRAPDGENEIATVPAAEGDTVVFKDYNIIHGQEFHYRLVSVDDRGLSSGVSIMGSAVAIGPPHIAFSTNSLDFGSLPNNESEIETFTVYNNGDTELTIFEMGFNHGDYFHFPEVKSNTWIISPGDSLIVPVGFFPGIGNFTDSVYVLSDDIIPETDSLQYVALSGTGLNHAPTTFNLIEPVHLDSLTIEEFNEITFKWHAATDEDMDDLTYSLVIADLESDTTFSDITDTSFTVQLVQFLEYDKPYAWSVFVTDGQSVTVSADTFGFFTPLLSGIGDVEGTLPTVYNLHNNYPNPFNPTTTINYDLPRASHVSLSVYNVLGQLVKVLVDGEKPLGSHTAVWDGKDRFGVNVSSGIYMLVMRSGDFTSVQKMTLMK